MDFLSLNIEILENVDKFRLLTQQIKKNGFLDKNIRLQGSKNEKRFPKFWVRQQNFLLLSHERRFFFKFSCPFKIEWILQFRLLKNHTKYVEYSTSTF